MRTHCHVQQRLRLSLPVQIIRASHSIPHSHNGVLFASLGEIRRVTMPQLSPTFTGGSLKWTHSGSEVSPYAALFEVLTDSLTEDHVRNKISSELIIESTDGGFLSRKFVTSGATVRPGTLLAVIVENEEDLHKINAISTMNNFSHLDEFVWQAYLKNEPSFPTCS